MRDSLTFPPDPLVGRENALASIDALLADPATRLVTLTGPPGVGKSRLALAVAAAAAPRFADGVRVVDLGEVRDPELVPAAVLDAVGVDAVGFDAVGFNAVGFNAVGFNAVGFNEVGGRTVVQQLRRVLADKNLLLVIDNFEHVLDAGPPTVAALARCGGVRVLMTSRERLHLRAEREFPVPPLELPGEHDAPGQPAAPALEMLVQCVRRFEPGFAVTAANRAALVEICARLDGLPLALELAAARLRLFTPGELTFRLRHRMAILTGTVRDVSPRHRTLRAALMWSHDLLKPDERAAFRRLSVFVGGATLEAAGQVCDLGDPVATVTSLVDKSLLQRRVRPDGVAEFVMLESLREYAAERLVEQGEQDAVDARHAGYFADFAVLVDMAVGEAARADWAESVRVEQGNLRKALAYATSVADAGLSLPLAAALGRYSSQQDRASLPVDPAPTPAARDSLSRALLVAAVPALGRGELDDAEVLLSRVLTVEEDPHSAAIATAMLGHVADARGHRDRAAGHHARAADMFAALGDVPGLAWSRYDLALLARDQGDAAGAAGHLRESLTRFREIGDARAVAGAAWALMTVETGRDPADDVERLLVEAHGCSAAVPGGPGVAACLADASTVGCAHRAPDAGRPTASRRAVATLPRDPSAAPRGAAGDGSDGALTARERQVARLVAGGSTNRQIGRALGIAEKTTEAHVHNIIRKLGAQNRAAVAAWMSAHDEPD